MSDITLCREAGCPKKGTCLRYLEPPSHESRFFIFSPLNDENKCTKYLEVKMTELEYLNKVKKCINVAIQVESKKCESWKDSGDRGACYAHAVQPLRNLLEVTDLKIEEIHERG